MDLHVTLLEKTKVGLYWIIIIFDKNVIEMI